MTTYFGRAFLINAAAKSANIEVEKWHIALEGLVATAVGGTVSEITGGKFGNGAFSALFAFVANRMQEKNNVGNKKQLRKHLQKQIEELRTDLATMKSEEFNKKYKQNKIQIFKGDGDFFKAVLGNMEASLNINNDLFEFAEALVKVADLPLKSNPIPRIVRSFFNALIGKHNNTLYDFSQYHIEGHKTYGLVIRTPNGYICYKVAGFSKFHQNE